MWLLVVSRKALPGHLVAGVLSHLVIYKRHLRALWSSANRIWKDLHASVHAYSLLESPKLLPLGLEVQSEETDWVELSELTWPYCSEHFKTNICA